MKQVDFIGEASRLFRYAVGEEDGTQERATSDSLAQKKNIPDPSLRPPPLHVFGNALRAPCRQDARMVWPQPDLTVSSSFFELYFERDFDLHPASVHGEGAP